MEEKWKILENRKPKQCKIGVFGMIKTGRGRRMGSVWWEALKQLITRKKTILLAEKGGKAVRGV